MVCGDRTEALKVAQDAAQKAHDRMLDMLLGYDPVRQLRVEDIKFISEWTRTVAFDATAPFRTGGE